MKETTSHSSFNDLLGSIAHVVDHKVVPQVEERPFGIQHYSTRSPLATPDVDLKEVKGVKKPFLLLALLSRYGLDRRSDEMKDFIYGIVLRASEEHKNGYERVGWFHTDEIYFGGGREETLTIY